MDNNEILRRIRYAFDYTDAQMISIFSQAEREVTQPQLLEWFTKEEDDDYIPCKDVDLASFLNGLIIQNRGLKGDSVPAPDTRLTNNMILNKLKIALDLQSEDMLDVLLLADCEPSKHELSALFRKPGHKHYRQCLDQFLRNFLKGMNLKYREESRLKRESEAKND